MKKIIADLRNMLDCGAFEKEEHVRIGIVARICQALGWDIWNPEEFYTEFSIKLKNKEGSVDVALFHSHHKERTPDVFFEVKAVGKLKGNIESSEDQLQEYNYYNTASITVLTDGRSWRLYLSSATGTFNQKLFCAFNLMEDDENYICKILSDILSKDRFTRDAVNCAEKMLSDLKLSKEIERAKNEATRKGDEYPDLNKYQLVQLMLKEHGREIQIDEIKRLWDKTTATVDENPSPHLDTPPHSSQKQYQSSGKQVEVFIDTKGVKASGMYDPQSKQLVLRKGSEIVKDHSTSFEGGHLEEKERMIVSGELYLDSTGSKYLLRQDKPFKSPSGAARLVLGRSSNGYTDWYDADGNHLDIHRL